MSTQAQNPKVRDALAFLEKFTNYERAPQYIYTGQAMNLERVRKLLEAVGSPEKKLRAVHIAGTKGKGSIAKMINAVLNSAGYRVGLYTSPHLVVKNERILVNDEMVSDRELADAIDALRPGVDAVHAQAELGEVTYFELITAAAFFHFAVKKVDYAVLETGLGGRFDATNVCNPSVVVITPVSLDHTDILGDTVAKIASEKAMIIKQGSKVVVAPQPKDAMAMIEGRGSEMDAQIFPAEKFYQWKMNYIYPMEMSFDLTGKRNLIGLKTKMIGPHQMQNAATAVLACDLLSEQGAGVKVSDDTIRYGLAKTRLAARFQQLEFAGRTVILDGAHNADSAKALAETLALVYPGKKFNFMIGMGRDKDIAGFLNEVKPVAKRIVLCRAHHSRAEEPEQMKKYLADFSGEVIIQPEINDALGQITRLGKPGEVFVITGSFFLIGEAVEWFWEKETEIPIP